MILINNEKHSFHATGILANSLFQRYCPCPVARPSVRNDAGVECMSKIHVQKGDITVKYLFYLN